MADSILNKVKSYLGVAVEDTAFDPDILMAINAAIAVLIQFGVDFGGPFVIENSTQTWPESVSDWPVALLQEYVNMKVRTLFDPPTNTYVANALEKQLDEFEWRIIVETDKKFYGDGSNG